MGMRYYFCILICAVVTTDIVDLPPLSFRTYYKLNSVYFKFFRGKYKIAEKRSGTKCVMILTILDVSHEDYASYTCVASNIKGKSDATIRLYGEYTFLRPSS